MEQILSWLLIALKLMSFYFVLLALFAFKKPKPIPRAQPSVRFACVIAARNEARVIGALIESILRQDYPRALFDVYVLPNNCRDNTALCALQAGAKLIHPGSEITCKGDALHAAIGLLLPERYDAFCVLDADNVLDAHFLSRMNDAFCAGAQVVKSAMRVKNPEDGALCGCYGLYFALFDFFFSRARMACGLSAKLVGTGFAVHRSVLQTLGGWNSCMIAEDAEFASLCAERGIRIWFQPEAVTYDEAPVSFKVSLRQRRRWASGVMDVGIMYAAQLWLGIFSGGALRALDMLLMLMQPYCQTICFLLTAALCASEPGASRLCGLFLSLIPGYFGAVALAQMLRKTQRLDCGWKSLLLFPVFMASWLPINVVSFFFRTRAWSEIRHGEARRAAPQKVPSLLAGKTKQ